MDTIEYDGAEHGARRACANNSAMDICVGLHRVAISLVLVRWCRRYVMMKWLREMMVQVVLILLVTGVVVLALRVPVVSIVPIDTLIPSVAHDAWCTCFSRKGHVLRRQRKLALMLLIVTEMVLLPSIRRKVHHMSMCCHCMVPTLTRNVRFWSMVSGRGDLH
jgi:hypothetical protein